MAKRFYSNDDHRTMMVNNRGDHVPVANYTIELMEVFDDQRWLVHIKRKDGKFLKLTMPDIDIDRPAKIRNMIFARGNYLWAAQLKNLRDHLRMQRYLIVAKLNGEVPMQVHMRAVRDMREFQTDGLLPSDLSIPWPRNVQPAIHN